MKQLFAILLLASSILVATNFSGHQSLVNLGDTTLFKAPISPAGSYFINGQLTLPQKSKGTNASQVVATIYSGSALIYTGTAGATGFGMPAVSITPDDTVKVNLSSTDSVDMGLNVIKGDVFFGNVNQ